MHPEIVYYTTSKEKVKGNRTRSHISLDLYSIFFYKGVKSASQCTEKVTFHDSAV